MASCLKIEEPQLHEQDDASLEKGAIVSCFIPIRLRGSLGSVPSTGCVV